MKKNKHSSRLRSLARKSPFNWSQPYNQTSKWNPTAHERYGGLMMSDAPRRLNKLDIRFAPNNYDYFKTNYFKDGEFNKITKQPKNEQEQANRARFKEIVKRYPGLIKELEQLHRKKKMQVFITSNTENNNVYGTSGYDFIVANVARQPKEVARTIYHELRHIQQTRGMTRVKHGKNVDTFSALLSGDPSYDVHPVEVDANKYSDSKVPNKDLTWPQASRRFPRLNPLGDADRDGVKNMFDCRPFDKTRDAVYNLSSLSAAKRRVILNNPNYLYHKTEYSNIPSIIKKGTLQVGDKPFSLSQNSNPHVVFKTYTQPAVMVLNKKNLSKLRKIDYKNPKESASQSQTTQALFKDEEEWLAEGSVSSAIRGVILNENIAHVKNKAGLLASGEQGMPTRYVTDEDMTKTKFKKSGRSVQ